ncbi:hypothetical protein L2E82_48537 [Cichorium intybus]|uniref:Uncharacterized protein n=1 Tax=Cichorium intybus TaxID=13427 RepID=A0ACB8YYN3_CICIN|nr:hypothetical protein L2E82_48537 [Cichorium intybus]
MLRGSKELKRNLQALKKKLETKLNEKYNLFNKKENDLALKVNKIDAKEEELAKTIKRIVESKEQHIKEIEEILNEAKVFAAKSVLHARLMMTKDVEKSEHANWDLEK